MKVITIHTKNSFDNSHGMFHLKAQIWDLRDMTPVDDGDMPF